jgi:hypothetical protein
VPWNGRLQIVALYDVFEFLPIASKLSHRVFFPCGRNIFGDKVYCRLGKSVARAKKQCGMRTEVDGLKRLQAETAAELDLLMPSILDKAFRGQL